MKYLLTFLQITLLASAFVFGQKDRNNGNEYVTTRISVKQQELKYGDSGEIVIFLKPKRGIHINLTPAIEVKFDSASARLASTRPLEIPKGSKSNYLDTKKGVTQRFTLSSAVRPGLLTLKGTITYYYCSDAAGWCSKFKEPIEASMTIIP